MFEYFEKRKLKKELEELKSEINDYLRQIYYHNFIPNTSKLYLIRYSNNLYEEKSSALIDCCRELNKADCYKDFLKLLTGDSEEINTFLIYKYINAYKGYGIKYFEKVFKRIEVTKLNGETFDIIDNSLSDSNIVGTMIYWPDDSVELFQKIHPIYDIVEKDFVWDWSEISVLEIESKYIDFKTREERIMKYDL